MLRKKTQEAEFEYSPKTPPSSFLGTGSSSKLRFASGGGLLLRFPFESDPLFILSTHGPPDWSRLCGDDIYYEIYKVKKTTENAHRFQNAPTSMFNSFQASHVDRCSFPGLLVRNHLFTTATITSTCFFSKRLACPNTIEFYVSSKMRTFCRSQKFPFEFTFLYSAEKTKCATNDSFCRRTRDKVILSTC
jgi:hypothetical protein